MKISHLILAVVVAITIILTSCGKVPQEKLTYAKFCMDSLKVAGAQNSSRFLVLQDTMKAVQVEIEVQITKLFKKFVDIENTLDRVIAEAHRFVTTNDIPMKRQPQGNNTIVVNTEEHSGVNTYSFDVEIDMNAERILSPDQVLEMANKIDQAVRNNVGLDAKLIRVKVN